MDENLTGKLSAVGSLTGVLSPGQVGGGSAKLQSKSVSPARTAQTVLPDEGFDGLSEVNISAVILQSKTVTPTAQQQVVTADSGYVGLGSVTVEAASGGVIPEIYCRIVPTDVFEGAVMDALRLPATSGIKTGAFANINGEKHFDLYLNDTFYVHPTADGTSSSPTGYPFGNKTDVTVHVPKSMRTKYDSSTWAEFQYEHEGFLIVYED